jgi:hypothetical protein
MKLMLEDEGGMLLGVVALVTPLVMDVEARISGSGGVAEINKELMESPVPCQWGLLEAVECLLQVADIVGPGWVNKTLRLGYVDFLIKDSLRKALSTSI